MSNFFQKCKEYGELERLEEIRASQSRIGERALERAKLRKVWNKLNEEFENLHMYITQGHKLEWKGFQYPENDQVAGTLYHGNTSILTVRGQITDVDAIGDTIGDIHPRFEIRIFGPQRTPDLRYRINGVEELPDALDKVGAYLGWWFR